MTRDGTSTSSIAPIARAAVWLAVAAAVFIGAWYVIGVIEAASWDAGVRRAETSLALLLVTLGLVVVTGSRPLRNHIPRAKLGWPVFVLLCCVSLPALYTHSILFARRFESPHLNDIPLTTMAAARVLMSGENPYRAPVDPREESRAQGRNYDGFKYMPLMAVLYSPAALLHSDRAVIVINAILDALTAVLIVLIARSVSDPILAGFAVLLYLWLSIVPRQLFGPGVTDLAAVVPLLAAFWIGATRPMVSGLLVGVSLSMKLVPALAIAPILAPPLARWGHAEGRRFWAGLLCGFVPVMAYFAWSPADFLNNVLFFNVFRPVDSTSWMDGHPASWRLAATVLLVLVLAGGTLFRWTSQPSLRTRVVVMFALSVSLTLLGPVNHGNYQLWWIPWFAVVLAACFSRGPEEKLEVRSQKYEVRSADFAGGG
jgi:hypothetical protein